MGEVVCRPHAVALPSRHPDTAGDALPPRRRPYRLALTSAALVLPRVDAAGPVPLGMEHRSLDLSSTPRSRALPGNRGFRWTDQMRGQGPPTAGKTPGAVGANEHKESEG